MPMDVKTPTLSDVGYASSPPTIPCKRDKAGWLLEHSKHIELSKNPRVGHVLLIGDDIFAGLPNFPHIWSRHLAPLHALNYGLYGDQTQHVLWRVQNGLIPVNVEIIIIYVGANNLGLHKSVDIANGITCIAMVCREQKVNVKIVISGLLPTYNSYSTHFGKYAIKKAKNVNKYLKLFCVNGLLSDCFYLKPDKDWLLPDGSLNTLYYLNGLSEMGNEKFTKSLADIINTLNVGVKIEMSSDSDISSEDEPSLPLQQKSTSHNISMLRNSIKKKNSVSPDKPYERPRSRRDYSSCRENDSRSYKNKRPISPVRTHSRHRRRSHYSRSTSHKSRHSSSSRKRSKSRSRSNSSGCSSRSISPVFTVRRGPDGRISKSKSISPVALEKDTRRRRKSRSRSSDCSKVDKIESITTPGALARSRSRSKCRSRSRSVSKDMERDRWIKRACSRLSPETKASDSFQLKSSWNNSSPAVTEGNQPIKEEGSSNTSQVDSESIKESQSTMKMYGLFLKELEEINKKESQQLVPVLASTNGKVEGT